ncbi:MAG: heavy metal translocating P-type ATPase [Leptospiraceae bacterium]|nr:copper-translocating P-type ATPase [Leptospiraceae bacterium]MCK6380029.1 heavy metal translocating P-type ATPase [Leptospiraceae bacterium]
MKEALTQFQIEGMTCTACSNRIEKNLNKIPGIKAEVNFASEKATIHFLDGKKDIALIEKAVEKTGYKAREIVSNYRSEISKKRELLFKKELGFFIFSAILTIPLMIPMFTMFLGIHFSIPALIQLILATPVQFIAGFRFYKGAFYSLRSKSANMDVLVSLGTTMAYLLSLYYTIYGDINSHLYFEASATVITLVRLGKLLEERAKGKTSSALEELIRLQPKNASVIRNSEILKISTDEIQVKDIFLVKSGESIPVDGIILEGSSSLDESMLTGESIPRPKTINDKVFSGTLNLNGLLKVQATEVGEKTYLSKIVQLVTEAMESKAPIQKFVDKISEIFVPTVVSIAVITFLGWYFYSGDLNSSIINAVSVLVIACPCALGLATPTAIMVGSGKGSELGILIKDATSLEKIGSVQTMVFDKTGTITEGNFTVSKMENYSNRTETQILEILSTLEQGSTHPLALSILNYAKEKSIQLLEVSEFHNYHGKGTSGIINGKKYFLGSKLFITENTKQFSDPKKEFSGTRVYLSDENSLLSLVYLKDEIKKDALFSIQIIQSMGITPIILSGDIKESVEKTASELGITKYLYQVLPEEKANKIKELKQNNTLVAMVGDGVNDSVALAEADIGFTLGSGSGVAIETADVTLIKNTLISIPVAIQLSKSVIQKIKQNLFFAFFYNIIGIPLAALGMLNPMIAGAAMAMSSVSVITNSLLFKRWKPKLKGVNL